MTATIVESTNNYLVESGEWGTDEALGVKRGAPCAP